MTDWTPDPLLLSRPAYLSLAEQFVRAIESGLLSPGTRLIPHRRLADDLGLSTQTVSRAYEELSRRGLIAGEIGRGSFVLRSGQEVQQPYLPERMGELIDLSILKPVTETMHLERLRAGFGWLAENLSSLSALSFRPNNVLPRHRVVASDWLARGGVEVAPTNILITNGATAAITAALMGVVRTGAALAVESLTHHTLMPLCTYLGVHLEGVDMDGEGMVPAALDELCRRVAIRAIFLQPSIINPLAAMMGPDRRAELVAVARRHDLAIIENDILNVMVPDRPAPFVTLAPERVLHINGFTKITVPGLRLAYLTAPDRYVAAVANRHLVSNWMVTPPMVELLSHWLTDGTAQELILWQRRAIADRHLVAQEMLAGLPYLAHSHSLHVWLPLPEGRDEADFVQECRLRGVAVAAGTAFRATERQKRDAVRISLCSSRVEELRAGLGVVGSILRESPEALLAPI